MLHMVSSSLDYFDGFDLGLILLFDLIKWLC